MKSTNAATSRTGITGSGIPAISEPGTHAEDTGAHADECPAIGEHLAPSSAPPGRPVMVRPHLSRRWGAHTTGLEDEYDHGAHPQVGEDRRRVPYGPRLSYTRRHDRHTPRMQKARRLKNHRLKVVSRFTR